MQLLMQHKHFSFVIYWYDRMIWRFYVSAAWMRYRVRESNASNALTQYVDIVFWYRTTPPNTKKYSFQARGLASIRRYIQVVAYRIHSWFGVRPNTNFTSKITL